MDEEVVAGQEDSEAGVAVVPADDLFVGRELRFEHLVDVCPRLLGESEGGLLLVRADGRDRARDERQAAVGWCAADEDAADLAVGATEDVGVNRSLVDGLESGDLGTGVSSAGSSPRGLYGCFRSVCLVGYVG